MNNYPHHSITARHRNPRSRIRCDTWKLLLSFLVPSSQTSGRLAIIHVRGLKGSDPVPNIHRNEREVYLILEGTVEFYLEGETAQIVAEVGDTVFVPCGKGDALKYRFEQIQIVMTLSAVDEKLVGADRFFHQMALGPAQSMELDPVGTHYADLTDAEIIELQQTAEEVGLELLSPEETLTPSLFLVPVE